jgi:hypothetical protein
MERLVKRAMKPKLPIPQHDYGPALQSAVSWLGDRYLLADPVTRRNDEPKPFFNEPRRWHDALRTLQ